VAPPGSEEWLDLEFAFECGTPQDSMGPRADLSGLLGDPLRRDGSM